jgi:hypothetical protein
VGIADPIGTVVLLQSADHPPGYPPRPNYFTFFAITVLPGNSPLGFMVS